MLDRTILYSNAYRSNTYSKYPFWFQFEYFYTLSKRFLSYFNTFHYNKSQLTKSDICDVMWYQLRNCASTWFLRHPVQRKAYLWNNILYEKKMYPCSFFFFSFFFFFGFAMGCFFLLYFIFKEKKLIESHLDKNWDIS